MLCNSNFIKFYACQKIYQKDESAMDNTRQGQPVQRRRSGRGCIFSLIALALLIAGGIFGYNTLQARFLGNNTAASTCPSNTLVLNMYYGSAKSAWINDEVNDYNSHNTSVCFSHGPIGPGQSRQQIVAVSIQPDICCPDCSCGLPL